jgi:hypothetical protein
MRNCFVCISLTLLPGMFVSCYQDALEHRVVIEAANFPRQSSPLMLLLPELDTAEMYILTEGKDQWPLQHLEKTKWVCIPDRTIEAGEEVNMHIVQRENVGKDQLELHRNDSSLSVSVGNQTVLVYNTSIKLEKGIPEYYQRSGFIHPAYSPDGLILTDGFPIGHRHQHGIFFAWVNTVFEDKKVDFWNQQHQTGTVLFDSIVAHKTGPVFAEFVTRQQHVALQKADSVVVLSEQWTVRVYNLTDYFMWDIHVLQENVSDSTLYILPYHYGGLGVRGSAEWNDTTVMEGVELTGPGKGGFITSEGKGRLEGNHSRPQWVTMFGEVDQTKVNLTVIQNKSNPGAPHYVRIHPTMPYFCYVPVVENGLELHPGDLHSSSYRILTYNTLLDTIFINNLAKSYNISLENTE